MYAGLTPPNKKSARHPSESFRMTGRHMIIFRWWQRVVSVGSSRLTRQLPGVLLVGAFHNRLMLGPKLPRSGSIGLTRSSVFTRTA